MRRPAIVSGPVTHIQTSWFTYQPPAETPVVLRPSIDTTPSWDPESLWSQWHLTTKGVIIFNDRVSGDQVAVDRDLIRKFISSGRRTTTRYRISMVGSHTFTTQHDAYNRGRPQQVGPAPTYTIKLGLRLDYQSATLKGYVVFEHLAGIKQVRSAKEARLWANPLHVFLNP